MNINFTRKLVWYQNETREHQQRTYGRDENSWNCHFQLLKLEQNTKHIIKKVNKNMIFLKKYKVLV